MSIRVLLVDDDDQIRRALGTSLARAGFAVTNVDDGVPALALAETQFDVLVVDFNLKTMTGADVVRHFKARYGAQLYCIVLSGEDSDETRHICLQAGANDILLKPMSPSMLRDRLTEGVAVARAA